MSDRSRLPLWAHHPDSPGFFRLIRLFRKRVRLIVSTWILFVLAGLAFALLPTPIYRAEIVVFQTQSDESGYSLGALSGQFGALGRSISGFSSRSTKSSEIALATLRSREFAFDFIEQLNMLPILFDYAWDSASQEWFDSEAPSLLDGFKVIRSIRRIAPDPETGLVVISFDWKDPKTAARWADETVALANKRLRERAIDDSTQNLEFLEKQLVGTNPFPVQVAINELVESEMKKAMLANVNSEYAFRVIDPAVVPEKKISPKRLLIVAASVLLGFFSGLVLAYFLELVAMERKALEAATSGD